MNILFLGDVNGKVGRRMVQAHLNSLILEHQVDFTIANIENAAAGFGVTPQIADESFALGIDVLTSGNHIWDKKEIVPYLEDHGKLLRPFNYPPSVKGHGWCVERTRGGEPIAVVNLMGRAFMPPIDCPFQAIERLLPEIQREAKIIIVDMHGEASSEKQAMGVFLDGKVSAVIGTHTHVQTADERIWPAGTGYITDAGFAGGLDSVIGVIKEQALLRFLTDMPTKFESATGHGTLQGVVVGVVPETGRCVSIQRIRVDEQA